MDNVRAAAESLAQAITNPAVRAAWLAYAAAQSERDASQSGQIMDLIRSMSALRGELDAAIDSAVKRALEGSELRVHGLSALVDAMNAFNMRLNQMETRADIRTEMLRVIMERLDALVPPPPKPIPDYEDVDDPTGVDGGAHPNG